MSYYDSDSEDEYYGYYGKNNHRKPKPSPTPPSPNPTISEPDPYELDHNNVDSPTPFEPDYHNTECTNTDREDDANDADWEDDGEHETEVVGAYEYGTPGYEDDRGCRHGEREFEAETEEHEEGVLAGGEYEEEELEELGPEDKVDEHGELEYEGDQVHEHEGLKYEDGIDERERLETGKDEVYELRELEHEPQEPYELEYEPERSDSNAHCGIDEPRTLKSSGVPQRAEPKHEGPGRHTHAHHYPIPTPRNVPRSNRRGRATAVKDVQHRMPPYPTLHHPLTHTPPVEPAHGTPNPPIAQLRPPPWPDPNTHHPYTNPRNRNGHTSTTPSPITPTHREIPTQTSITRSRPPPWPDNAHNTHLPQPRPPPWPD
jgi:hypothetical protein